MAGETLMQCPSCHKPMKTCDGGHFCTTATCWKFYVTPGNELRPAYRQEGVSEALRATDSAGKRKGGQLPADRRKGLQDRQAGLEQAVMAVEFEFPLPPTGCSANGAESRDWRYKSKAAKSYRDECFVLLPCIVGLVFRRARISCVFYHGAAAGRYHARDTQNAIFGIKAAVDALVDAGYLRDDGSKYLEWGTVKLLTTAKEHEGKACVRVRMEAIE